MLASGQDEDALAVGQFDWRLKAVHLQGGRRPFEHRKGPGVALIGDFDAIYAHRSVLKLPIEVKNADWGFRLGRFDGVGPRGEPEESAVADRPGPPVQFRRTLPRNADSETRLDGQPVA